MIAPQFGDGKFSPPAVIDQGAQGHGLPVGLSRPAKEQFRGQDLMAVGHDVRLHPQAVSHRSFGGKQSAVDFRGYPLNDYTLPGDFHIRPRGSLGGQDDILLERYWHLWIIWTGAGNQGRASRPDPDKEAGDQPAGFNRDVILPYIRRESKSGPDLCGPEQAVVQVSKS